MAKDGGDDDDDGDKDNYSCHFNELTLMLLNNCHLRPLALVPVRMWREGLWYSTDLQFILIDNCMCLWGKLVTCGRTCHCIGTFLNEKG